MKMDTDKDGTISFEEFYTFYLNKNGLNIEERKTAEPELATVRFTENL